MRGVQQVEICIQHSTHTASAGPETQGTTTELLIKRRSSLPLLSRNRLSLVIDDLSDSEQGDQTPPKQNLPFVVIKRRASLDLLQIKQNKHITYSTCSLSKVSDLSPPEGHYTPPKGLFFVGLDSNQAAGFTNLTTAKVPTSVSRLLTLGSGFTPLTRVTEAEVYALFDSIIEQLRGCFKRFPNYYVQTIRTKFKRCVINFVKTSVFEDMTPIFKFIKDTHVVIKKADKNLGLTIMPFFWYDKEVMAHLNDRSTYRKVDHIRPSLIKQVINNVICRYERFIKPYDLQKLRYSLNVENTTSEELKEFYGIPKLHKDPIKLRPIGPSLSWVTTDLAKWLDRQLQPVIKSIEWIIPNTIRLINLIENYHFNDDIILVTCDIESLYTSIDLGESFTVLKRFMLDKSMFPTLLNEWVYMIIDCLTIVMSNNYFTYRNTKYHQVRGTAMGCNVAPCFANLFVAAYEYEFKQYRTWPKHYVRYIDDIFFIWERGENNLIRFLDLLNSMSPSLKFTYSKGDSVNYLDLVISKGTRFHQNGILDITCYRKPYNPLLYTNPTTYNAHHVVFNWIQGECIRLVRNNSSEEGYMANRKSFEQALLDRKYNIEEIKRQFAKVNYSKRSVYIKEDVNDVTDEVGVQKVTKIFIKNIPGRHIVRRYIRMLVQMLQVFNHENASTHEVRIITTKGTKIMDFINSAVKEFIRDLS
jgi:hypothetical protein